MKTNLKKAGTMRRVARKAEVERLVPVRMPARVLTDNELLAALRVDENNELWLAVNQILSSHISNATAQVSLPDTAANHGLLAHCAGGLEWLQYLQGELHGRREQAMMGETLLGDENSDAA